MGKDTQVATATQFLHQTLNTCNFFTLIFLLFITGFLSGCSSPDSQLPPLRPPGTITGQVIDSKITNATVTLYSYKSGERGDRLGSGLTDDNGEFAIEIRAADQVIMVEASGGSYIEQASGKAVALKDGQTLRGLVNYISGQSVDVLVTPFTHLTTALALHDVAQGIPIEMAQENAKQLFDTFFTVNTTDTIPLDLSTQTDVASLSEEALYAFYLAGVSNWTAWASGKNSENAHITFTSIGLYQIMYDDLLADGLLNGIGYSNSMAQAVPLTFGNVPLTTDEYRSMFSIHMLAASTIDYNATQIKPTDLSIVAQDIASKSSGAFGIDAPVLDLSLQTPTPSVNSLEGFKSGTVNVNVNVAGFLGPKLINWSIANCNINQTIENPDVPQISIDTKLCTVDAEYTVSLTVVDPLGNAASTTFQINIDNTLPTLVAPAFVETNTNSVALTGTYSDGTGSGLASIVLDRVDVNNNVIESITASIVNATDWTATINVTPGENNFKYNVYDQAGNNNTSYVTKTYLDDLPPTIGVGPHSQNARFVDSAAQNGFRLAPLADENTTALYIETDKLSLRGVNEDRDELDGVPIPYFKLSISDQKSLGNFITPPDNLNFYKDLTVEISYYHSEIVISNWGPLKFQNCLDPAIKSCGHVLPLVTKYLTSNWSNALPTDQHIINIRVTDPAGNQSTKTFTFYAEFFPPPADD